MKTPPPETPPHGPVLEEALIGSALENQSVLRLLLDHCLPADFYTPACRELFLIFRDQDEFELGFGYHLTLERLRSSKLQSFEDWRTFCERLLDSPLLPVSSEVLRHIEQLHGFTHQREEWQRNQRIRALTFNAELSDEERAQRIAAELEQRTATVRGVVAAEPWMLATCAAYGPEAAWVQGVPVGLGGIDGILNGGWLPGNLYILAGDSGMGKSMAMVECMQNAAFQGFPVGVLSLEMTKEQLGARLIANESTRFGMSYGLPLTRILNHANPNLYEQLDHDQEDIYHASVAALKQRPLYIHDGAGMGFEQIALTVRELRRKHGLQAIFIDHLQIIHWDQRLDTNTAIERLTGDLKNLAKREKVAIVLLSQLTKDPGKRGTGKERPGVNDLRGSGAIRANADVVAMLYRPQYYARRLAGVSDDGTGECEWIFGKNRQGPEPVIKLGTAFAYCRYLDQDQHHGEPPPGNHSGEF